MSKYAVSLAYNGKNYHGWQIQPNAKTVQETIQTTFARILQQNISVTGSGRTDTGVHASFYVLDFETNSEIKDLKKQLNSFNSLLPNDISIFSINQVSSNFNSRFDAISRTYKYHISKIKSPFLDKLTLVYRQELDINSMNNACKILLEYEDFESFEKLHSDNKTSKCQIFEAEWKEQDNYIIFNIKANRFLRNMVRSIVGTMLDIGKNKISLEKFRQIIEAKNRSCAGMSASPYGLYLTDIQYNNEYNHLFEEARQKSAMWII